MKGPIDDGRLIPTALRILRRNPVVWLFAALVPVVSLLWAFPGAAPGLVCASGLLVLYVAALSALGSMLVLRRSYFDQTAELKSTLREANSLVPRWAAVMTLWFLVIIALFACLMALVWRLPYFYAMMLMQLATAHLGQASTHMGLALITARLGVGSTLRIGFWHWNHDRVPKLVLALAFALLGNFVMVLPLIYAKGVTGEVLAMGYREGTALGSLLPWRAVTPIAYALMGPCVGAILTVLHMRRLGEAPAEQAAAAGVGPDLNSPPG